MDNVSTDNSGKICDEYREKDSRIKVIHMEKHGWVSDSRNEGLRIASGEWIQFIDSDDWIEKDCFEQVLGAMGSQNVDIFFEGGMYADTPDTSVRISYRLGNFMFDTREEINRLQVMNIGGISGCHYSLCFPWDKIYNRRFLFPL